MIVKFSKIEFVKMWKRLKEIEILAKGQDGTPGKNGRDGKDGANGLPGANGTDGAQGAPGAPGAIGATGAQGIQGNAGLQGIQGVKGDKGDTGTAGINGTNGADGIGTLISVGALIGTAGDATPNDSDFVATALTAGGLLKKITWTNVKAFLKTYFDTLYLPKTSLYRMRAYSASAQALTLNTHVIINVDTEIYDLNNNFSTSTHLYTAPVNGYYQVNGMVKGANFADGNRICAEIFKNGSIHSMGNDTSAGPAGAYPASNVSDILYLAANDTVALYGFTTATSKNSQPDGSCGLYLSISYLGS